MNYCDYVIGVTKGRNTPATSGLKGSSSYETRALNTYQKVVEKSLISDTIFLAFPPIYDVKMTPDLRP